MRIALVLAPLVLMLGSGISATADADTYKAKLKAFKSLRKAPSLYRRLAAQEALAKTKDKRALETLAKEYGRLPKPREQGQYLLAAACARHFTQAEYLPALVKWRERHLNAEHAWLWYQTFVVQGELGGSADLVAIAQGDLNAYIRAAAVAALTALRLPAAVDVIPGLLARLPKDDAQRIAMLNCIGAVLLSRSHEDGSPAHHGLARRLIDLLDKPTTPRQSKVVIARYLQRVFDVPYAFVESAPWRQVLASVQSLMEIPQLSGKQVPPVECAGIQARGSRIAYLIDLSEGGKQETNAQDEATLLGKTDAAAGADKAGRLRVLAMREAVAASLQKLKPEQHFAVLYCRHLDSGLVPGCTGMMPAIPRNVADVVAGLRTLTPKADADLHAGLMRAFELTEKQPIKKAEYVDPLALVQGCDTIFVVAQSGSVRDTWVAAGDAPDDPMRWSLEDRQIRGVYSDEAYLAEELRRWNLFRKAEIHGVPVGTAPQEAFENLFRPYRGWNTMRGDQGRTADEDAANELFSAVLRQYQAYLKRPSLFMRMRGRHRLAKTRHPNALDVLADSYADPEPPVDRVPHILVSLCSRHFGRPAHLPRFHQWRAKHTKSKDAWLWFRAAQLDLLHGDPQAVEAFARKHDDLYLQLAAARAIASQRKPNCIPLAKDLLATLPAEGVPRATAVEAVAALLEARGHMRGLADFAAPCEALIEHVRDGQLPLRTRKTIARHLARIFQTDMAYGLDADKWMRELKGAQAAAGETPEPEKPRDVYAPFEFVGIPSAGGRVCYVIDASDSMLIPVSEEERRRLSRVVTGAGKPEKPQEALPWDRINTRFDVAREYLKLSLRKLTADKAFAIVFFGTYAEPLPSTKSLVEASPANIKKAIKDLDAIQAGPETPARPHGTLKGFTNMHGGLSLAFRLTGEGRAGKDPYVDPAMLVAGVDTIFLLSDGDPSMDDYAAIDRPDPGDVQADPETRAAQEKVPDVTFYGPYVDFDGFLVDDVRRMNLFRNAAIHCIGIGEADMVLLREIASAGLGETKNLGKEE